MFAWLRPDPIKRADKRYQAKMRQAKESERYGDRGLQAQLYGEAEVLWAELEALKAQAPSS